MILTSMRMEINRSKKRGHTLIIVLILIGMITATAGYLINRSFGRVAKERSDLVYSKLQWRADGLLEEVQQNLKVLMLRTMPDSGLPTLPDIIVPKEAPELAGAETCATGSLAPITQTTGGQAIAVVENAFVKTSGGAWPGGYRFSEKCLYSFDEAALIASGKPNEAALAQNPLIKSLDDGQVSEGYRVFTEIYDSRSVNLGSDVKVYNVEIYVSQGGRRVEISAMVELRPQLLNYSLYIGKFDLNTPVFTFFGPGRFGGRVHVNNPPPELDPSNPMPTKLRFNAFEGPIVFEDAFTSSVPFDLMSDAVGPQGVVFKKGYGSCPTGDAGCGSFYTPNMDEKYQTTLENNLNSASKLITGNTTVAISVADGGSGCKVDKIDSSGVHATIKTVAAGNTQGEVIASDSTVSIAPSVVDCNLTILAPNIELAGSVRYRSRVENTASRGEMLGLFTPGTMSVNPQKAFPNLFPEKDGIKTYDKTKLSLGDRLQVDGVIIANTGVEIRGMENHPIRDLDGITNDGQPGAMLYNMDGSSRRACGDDCSAADADQRFNVEFAGYETLGSFSVYGMLFVYGRFKMTRVATVSSFGMIQTLYGFREVQYSYDPRLSLVSPAGTPVDASQLYKIVLRNKQYRRS